MNLLFWISILFILYTYGGYICLLFIWSRLKPKRISKAYMKPEPMASIIIAIYNEEQNIRTRLENLICQDYPLDKLEIIVVSDGSTDRSSVHVREFIEANSYRDSFPEIKLIELLENGGKPNALNAGVRQASGEYLIFTDARQKFDDNAISELMSNFNDPDVGCVSGELLFYENSHSTIIAEMSLYWTMEKYIRKMEGIIDSVAGATGAIYAIRKSLFRDVPSETLLDDVYLPMHVVLQGYRCVFEEKARAYDVISMSFAQEKRRKVRTLTGNYQLLKLMPELMSPIKNPIFFRFLSHKIFRLFVPFFFLAFIAASLLANGSPFYKITFIATVSVCMLPFFDNHLSSFNLISRLSNVSRTFLMLNFFALVAFYRFIFPGNKKIW